MISIDDGQCGKCAHFGEDTNDQRIVQIRINGEAPEELTESCGHPELASADLRVAPNSSCSRYTPHKQSA